MHMLSKSGKAYYGGLMKKKGVYRATDADHGFYKGRRREGAVLAQLIPMYRLRRMGLSAFQTHQDLSNALASTKWEMMEVAIENLFME